MYYTEFISKNKLNPKKTWEVINSVISTKHAFSPINFLRNKSSSSLSSKFNSFKTSSELRNISLRVLRNI